MIMYACNIIKTYLVHLDASIAFILSESQEWSRLVVLGVHYCRLGFFYVHYVAKSRPNLAVFRYLLDVFFLLSATKSQNLSRTISHPSGAHRGYMVLPADVDEVSNS